MAITREEAIALFNRVADAVNRQDAATILSFYAEDATVISPAFSEMHGKEAIAASWERMFTTFPDWTVGSVDVLVDGDRILAIAFNSFTDNNGWFGLPATGERVTYRNLLLLTLKDGKVVREERMYDIGAVTGLLEKVRLEQELKTAAQVQSSLLSRAVRTGSYYEAIGDSAPCRTIGGDFFEFMQLPSGGLAIAIGDVAGKGPSAALLASMLQGMLAVEAQDETSPAAVMSRLNRALLARRLAAQFASLVYAVLTPDGRFTYCNAGHNSPILLTGARVVRLDTGGLVVGGLPEATYEEETLHLHDGDTVVMFTDGVTEARNREGEEFGDERLISCLEISRRESAQTMVRNALQAVHGFFGDTQPADDITVAVIRFLKK
ncbi:MAG: SpoIIE family protein phosphatase [Candidatus Korobacteraceae bacterium]